MEEWEKKIEQNIVQCQNYSVCKCTGLVVRVILKCALVHFGV